MPRYVFLNFEDADPNAGGGVVRGTKTGVPGGLGGAAAGTLEVYRRRAANASELFHTRHAKYYFCQELIARDANGTLTKNDLADIRADCLDAKTIIFVIHGTPTDVDHGYSTQGNIVCTWQQLGKLALLMLPAEQRQTYNINLIMCYGARSQNAQFDHRLQVPANDLKTSFAYKFFRLLCVSRQVRLSARTGAVSNDGALDHTVETEEQVFSLLDKQLARQDRTLNKAAKDLQKDTYLRVNNITSPQFQQMMMKFVNNPNAPVLSPHEQFAKDYIVYSPFVNQYIDARHSLNGPLGNRSKFGKFVYSYTGGVCSIVSRYDTGNGADFLMYHGPLLY